MQEPLRCFQSCYMALQIFIIYILYYIHMYILYLINAAGTICFCFFFDVCLVKVCAG